MKTAFIFPGQGSQFAGMGRELYDSLPEVRGLYETASGLSRLDIKKLSFEGPLEDLNKDLSAQLCMFVCNEASRVAASKAGIVPDAVTGYSLGFYNALVAAGCISFEDGLRLVISAGGHALKLAGKTPGTMAAIIGLSETDLDAVCLDAGEVWVSNVNAARQILISGLTGPVNEAVRLSLLKGALHAYVLPMGAPYHCPLMEKASEAFRRDLTDINFKSPRIPLLSYIDAEFIDTPEQIIDLLARHLHSKVPWKDSVLKLLAEGYDNFVEVGPGSALTRMVRWVDRSVSAAPVQDIWLARV